MQLCCARITRANQSAEPQEPIRIERICAWFWLATWNGLSSYYGLEVVNRSRRIRHYPGGKWAPHSQPFHIILLGGYWFLCAGLNSSSCDGNSLGAWLGLGNRGTDGHLRSALITQLFFRCEHVNEGKDNTFSVRFLRHISARGGSKRC